MPKRILIAPLDWGLGHATRCIPIIREVLELGHTPVIAASGRPMALLRAEFPDGESVEFPDYGIEYPEGGGMAWTMAVAAPRILRRIAEEHEELQALIPRLRLDAVISDNRFGLHTLLVPCAYITHQVMIKAPVLEGLLHRLHRKYMDRYTELWVPDHAHHGLSGDLGHKYPLPAHGRHIGPLSRFSPTEAEAVRDVLVLISGPEPQRTRFERMVLEQLDGFGGTAMAVLGKPDSEGERTDSRGHRIVPHLRSDELGKEISASRLVISRSGYSTIMDLSVLGKRAVFVPTPGQTEQEYLAELFHRDGRHMRMLQGDFDLGMAVRGAAGFVGFEPNPSDGFKAAVSSFLSRL